MTKLRVAVRGLTWRLPPIAIPSRGRARMRRGARPWQRSRSRRSCRRRCNHRRRTRCYRRGRRRCNCRTGSWRCTRHWCRTGQAHTKHVNKTSDHLLVPLAGRLDAGDEEAAYILVRDYRATSERLGCTLKNVHCFAEQDSIRRQQLHKNTAGIRIAPPDQVNLVNRIEGQAGKTSPGLSDYRYQGSYWFTGTVNKLAKERVWGVKIGEHDQILVRYCVVCHTRRKRRAGKDVTDDKRIR